MEWLGRGTYPSRGIKNNDFQSPRLRNYEILSYFWWPLRSPGSPDELPSSADSVILPVCSFKWGLRGWKQGHQFFSIDRMSMNIVYVHHYTGIYVSLHKDFHVHVYLQTPYRFEARPPRQPREWHCGWSTQWGHVGTGPSGPSVSQRLGALDGFFAIIYLACHKLGFLLDFSDILQLKRSLKCVLLVTLSGHRNVTMKPHLAMWPG